MIIFVTKIMLHDYGRKIINAIFKKWTDCTGICVELGTKVQADSDRSDIGVFEIGLPPEQHGDYEQSTGIAAQESESTRIIAIAKDKGLFIAITDVSANGDNVLSDGRQLYFIDPIIKFKQPAPIVLDHYYKIIK